VQTSNYGRKPTFTRLRSGLNWPARLLLIYKRQEEHATAIPGLTLYRRTATTPCNAATYEPGLAVFVQGRKRVTLGGTTYLCDESTFLLTSVDVPVVSQIITVSERLLSSC
jgi:hypothetical protein